MFLLYISILLILLALLYIWSIKPNKKRDMSKFKDRLYAHRGLHNNREINPENSLLAFQMAVDENYGIELDVQVTRDNIAVIFHDNTLLRVCGSKTSIGDHTFEELKDFHLYKTDQKIPTLVEVLELVDGRVPLIVEIKDSSKNISKITYIAEILDSYRGIYCIESFNPIIVEWYKKNRPHVIRGQLSTYYKKKKLPLSRKFRNLLLENFMINFLSRPDFLGFNYKYKDMFSFKLCKTLYNPLTAAYTIKNQEDYLENKDDFHLIIFDSFIPEEKDS